MDSLQDLLSLSKSLLETIKRLEGEGGLRSTRECALVRTGEEYKPTLEEILKDLQNALGICERLILEKSQERLTDYTVFYDRVNIFCRETGTTTVKACSAEHALTLVQGSYSARKKSENVESLADLLSVVAERM